MKLSTEQQTSSHCVHTDQAGEVSSDIQGCEDCLKTGSRWVHLRICMTCGHVGCCDSSPSRHARKHYEESAHPIIRSFEEGETWAWCYEDQVYF